MRNLLFLFLIFLGSNILLASREKRSRREERPAQNASAETARVNAEVRKRMKKREPSSRFCGVSWHKSKGKWIAQIFYSERQHHLGYFTDEEEAARA